ncbi:hypothetical protein K470DRAFT_295302 [Piedraia hortae CBS 480.64]|uniref:SH3 domain-containing protein n=1 Tax=Piedraia hortae CBS 480.64 TaxID=1314780 RepID=A0A6A7BXE2_9PEZI|nr:hypothetical protein K470DRAFT_295302 [Piedraia hortae CBS 480.64]
MARPGIVRADTLDLQDQDSPSAAEHPDPAFGRDGLGPHQVSQLQHVIHERQSEEQLLVNAWAAAGRKDEPEDMRANGHGANGSAEPEYQDGDGDSDEELMDRISSSPSIDDEPLQSLAVKAQSQVIARELQQFRIPPDFFAVEGFGLGIQTSSRQGKVDQIPTSASSGSVGRPSWEDLFGRGSCPEQVSRPATPHPDEAASPDEFPIEEPPSPSAPTTSGLGIYMPTFGQSPSLISLESVDISECFLPENDPLLTENPQETQDDASDAFIYDFSSSSEGGSLHDTDDIDLEFVYALHTFVATVEGQANATKGDTMILLDDSNSYWWLVRLVKDSSIGYLPAEHIETPTERLARLNKHRNIDLAATMLSDNSEKTRNPLKKAMRRRNAKTVQFAPPTYVEASDREYSSDEDDEAEPMSEPAVAAQTVQRNGHVEPSAPENTPRNSEDEPKTTISAKPEPRRITLTPGLLREGSASPAGMPEGVHTGSAENLNTVISGPEPAPIRVNPKETKKKDKPKSGMLSGLFKRKDKKMKDEGIDKIVTDVGRDSRDSPRSSPVIGQISSPVEKPSPTDIRVVQPAAGKSKVPLAAPAAAPVSEQPKEGILSTIKTTLSPDQERPKKAKRAKRRVELDDFDSPTEEEGPNPFREQEGREQEEEGQEEEPIQQAEHQTHPTEEVARNDPIETPPTPPQEWSDANLRAWYDDGSEVRDLLTLVYDDTDVKPVPHDHPLIADLYSEERKTAARIMDDLDGLLQGFLQRRGITP